ncbi:hypothetical protein [Limosilactobacillus reuteri]|uniref:hypothetical protein n=1 Tax=Limosilactobacillus reuteri TaxID=1598 RepID=UPI001E46ADDB|nr:hypothetical protein [Limosilactobacillus reuteri]MCC4467340.1 hypothetical protein [Limosilactobacillus reuteri]MCC4473207.1 hypothetical protein [Limosilactobacillus reuteri]
MSKLEKMKECLLSSIEIDMQQIEEIKQQPQSQINFMGGVKEWYRSTGCSNYYNEIVQAIKSAEYKYPDSDSVWEKAEKIKDEIVREKLSLVQL